MNRPSLPANPKSIIRRTAIGTASIASAEASRATNASASVDV